ncbi:RBBP9/YdeN family alpha/beta hydrolase [Delftia lacustris]|uniref:RBBP9/YdeN family alpha/beta hydrolase n=1 Tax=Delftia lacustris TaxID=558537 RepID=UPI001FCB0897|nr:alpha/beta hydrolase [Delftia lacustris]BDE71031.1 alpha/beta hydrolase [Delftia lacustris]
MNPHRIIIVPGWRNSGPDHWQSLWAQQLPHAERVEQDDWLVPHRDPWVAALEQLVLSRPEPVVLAAHSLGCITAAHLGPEASARVRGALLVAPADPERRAQLADFAPVPYAPLPYRRVLVASSNDPYCPIRRAGAYARAWGSEFVRLQNAGHINVESGFGDWPLGLALLQSLMQGDSWQPAQPRPAVRSPRSPRPPRVAAAHASVSAGTGAGAPWAAGL